MSSDSYVWFSRYSSYSRNRRAYRSEKNKFTSLESVKVVICKKIAIFAEIKYLSITNEYRTIYIGYGIPDCEGSLRSGGKIADSDTEDPQGVRGRLHPRNVPAAQTQPQVAGSDRDRNRRTPRCGQWRNREFQCHKGIPEHSHRRIVLVRAVRRNRRMRELRSGCAYGTQHNDRIFVAEHQQAAPPRTRPQQSVGLLRGADTQSQRT